MYIASVSGAPYSEDHEFRRRARYAILAGLSQEIAAAELDRAAYHRAAGGQQVNDGQAGKRENTENGENCENAQDRCGEEPRAKLT